MHPVSILLALALPLVSAGDDQLWQNNKLTSAQPFSAKVLAVNVTWVGYNLLLESIGNGKKKHCIAQVEMTRPLNYAGVKQAQLPKPGPEWQFLNPSVEVERFSWSMGVWRIGRIFGEEDCLKKAVAADSPKPSVTAPAPDAGKPAEFVPPASYRSTRFVEYGGGPLTKTTADQFDRIETQFATADQQLVFTTASPPSSATKTTVAGIFLLARQEAGWRVSDELRFEASGKDSGASLEITSQGNGDPHFTITLNQGGRGHSFSQSVSYKIHDGKIAVDLPVPVMPYR